MGSGPLIPKDPYLFTRSCLGLIEAIPRTDNKRRKKKSFMVVS